MAFMSSNVQGTGPAGVASFVYDNRVFITVSKDIVKALSAIYGKLKTGDYNNAGLQTLFDTLCRGRSPSDAWRDITGLTILCNDVTDATALKQTMLQTYQAQGLTLLNVR